MRKRLLVALVLTMLVLAVAASPAFAYLSAQGGGAVQATRVLGRGLPGGTVPASHGGTGVLIALLLAVVIGAAVYAIAADRRGHAPARSAEPANLPAFKPAADQKRKAA